LLAEEDLSLVIEFVEHLKHGCLRALPLGNRTGQHSAWREVRDDSLHAIVWGV